MSLISREQARERARAEVRKQTEYLSLLHQSVRDLAATDDPWVILVNLRECHANRARRLAGFLDDYRYRR